MLGKLESKKTPKKTFGVGLVIRLGPFPTFTDSDNGWTNTRRRQRRTGSSNRSWLIIGTPAN